MSSCCNSVECVLCCAMCVVLCCVVLCVCVYVRIAVKADSVSFIVESPEKKTTLNDK